MPGIAGGSRQYFLELRDDRLSIGAGAIGGEERGKPKSTGCVPAAVRVDMQLMI